MVRRRGPLYASSSTGGDAVAFIAERDAGSMPVELHANVSKGLLIVSSFQTRLRLRHGPERRFAREFFRRADPDPPGRRTAPRRSPQCRPLSSSSAASTFVGSWRNTNTSRLRHRVGLVRRRRMMVRTMCIQGRDRSDCQRLGDGRRRDLHRDWALVRAGQDQGPL